VHTTQKKKEIDWAHPGRKLTTKLSKENDVALDGGSFFIVYGKPKDEAQ